jgi:aminoglycoside phosphotransferase (APT) family kinase protein
MMHADGREIGADLVRRLVAAQFPQWASLPICAFDSAGVDNAAFRLGRSLLIRLPRREPAAASLQKEQTWLPRLAESIPLPITTLAGAGRASSEFPWPWSVHKWIEGTTAGEGDVEDWRALGEQLAHFMIALQRIDPTDGPPPGDHNFGRGVPLAVRDRMTRQAIDAVADLIDARAALAAWEADARAPAWTAPPRWIHGDLHGQNLLLSEGRLCAVIDFGGLGVGDPACDLAVAWRLLPQDTRAPFREALKADDASWARGRAWALSISVRELEYYREETAPVLTGMARRTIAEVLAEH